MLFVVGLTIISTNMNNIYDDNHDLSYGLVSNETINDLEQYQTTLAESTNKGQSTLTSFGYFILSTLPTMILSANSLIWGFISGGFINNIVGLMNLGEFSGIIIIIFRLLYFFAIGFILMKILTKVNT